MSESKKNIEETKIEATKPDHEAPKDEALANEDLDRVAGGDALSPQPLPPRERQS